jgi:hypothetical protein
MANVEAEYGVIGGCREHGFACILSVAVNQRHERAA